MSDPAPVRPPAAEDTRAPATAPPAGVTTGLGGLSGASTVPAPDQEGATPRQAGRGRFTILRPHAAGGLGQVSLARDEKLGRHVALKEIRPDRRGDPALERRFLAEAAITGQLEHPGIVPVYALEDEDGQPFYVMRFIQGQTLAEAIAAYHRRPTPLAFRGLLRRFVEVCQTLAYAHSKGVVHRDLKPANIMLGDFGETLVLDWGLAKVVGPGPPAGGTEPGEAAPGPGEGAAQTQAGQVLGTPAYMSPEQAEGDPAAAGPATDIYALGAILYTLLAGAPPYRGGGAADVLARVRAGPPPRPSQVGRGAPRALEAVCLRAMARAAPGRYATAADLAQEVERWLGHEPVQAYREPWTARAALWARRHPVLAWSGLAGLVAALVLLSITTPVIWHWWNQAVIARDNEAEQRRDAERSIADAHRAVDLMLTEVGQTQLANVPQMEPVRRRLPEKALAFYQGFAERRRDNPALRADVAHAYSRVASVRYWLGQYEAATEAHREAIRRYAELAAEFPDDPLHRHNQAVNYHGLGDTLSVLQRPRETEEAYRQALAIDEELAAGPAVRAEFRTELAGVLNQLGNILAGSGRPAEAEKAHLRTLALWQALADEFPRDFQYRLEWTKVSNNLANLYFGQGKLDEAGKTYCDNLEVQRKLLAEFPAEPEARSMLAHTHYSLALLRRRTGPPAAAEENLRQAAEYQEKLAAEFPVTPWYRLALAETRQQLADLFRATGRPQAAEQSLGQAVEALRKLADEVPGGPDFRYQLAGAQFQRAELYRTTGRLPEATAAYRQCVGQGQKLVQDFPTTLAYRRLLAGAASNLAKLLLMQGQVEEADLTLREAAGHFQKLLEAVPAEAEYRRELAGCYANQGSVEARRGHLPEAEKALRTAVRLWEELAGEHPGEAAYALHLANGAVALGNLVRDTGRREEASSWYGRAIAALGPGEAPRDAAARQVLGTAHWVQADELAQLGRHAEAVPHWERAVALDGGANRTLLRTFKALSLARAGKPAEAVAEAEALAAAGDVKGETLYDLARACATAGAAARDDPPRAGRYGGRAVELLRKAHRAGFFKPAANRERLNRDADLEPLRGRADFRQLLADAGS
jgi:serine/threonine-protein kinase